MKLYIAHGQYVGTQADAKRIDKGFTAVEVPTDKEGLIRYLNTRQGELEDECTPVVERQDPRTEEPHYVKAAREIGECYDKSDFDDQWDTLPLARKLHFASLACEDARDAIKPTHSLLD